MDTQKFYRRVEITKCFILTGILVVLVLILMKIPALVTVEDLRQRKASLSQLPMVVVKDGRITVENEQIQVRGSVRIEEQPIEVITQERPRW